MSNLAVDDTLERVQEIKRQSESVMARLAQWTEGATSQLLRSKAAIS